MDANSRDALAAVVARRRGRARLRSATVALGAASLLAAATGTSHAASGGS